jgi:hypothetical protein
LSTAGKRPDHIPRNKTPAIISPQAIVIIQKPDTGNATTAMAKTGRSARTAQVTEIRKMMKERRGCQSHIALRSLRVFLLNAEEQAETLPFNGGRRV